MLLRLLLLLLLLYETASTPQLIIFLLLLFPIFNLFEEFYCFSYIECLSIGRQLVVVEVLEQRIAIPPAIAAAREQEVCADSGG